MTRILSAVVLLLVAGVMELAGQGPHKEIILPEGAEPSRLLSPVVRTGNLLFLSGALGFSPGGGGLVEGGIEAETRQTLENIRDRLATANATLADVVKCTVFLADLGDYRAMNEVYVEFFGDSPPARSAVQTGLVLNARVEIECIAAVRD